MNRLILLPAPLLLLLGTARADEAGDLLAGLARRNARTTTLRARYVQRRESDLLDKPLKSTGTILFSRRQGCLVFLARTPRKVVIRLDAHSYQVYEPGKKRAERFLFRKNFSGVALLRVFSRDVAMVRESYDLLKIERGEQATTVRLRPKSKQVRKRLLELSVTIHRKSFALTRFAYRDPSGDLVAIDLDRIERNPTLDERRLARELPPGTDLRVTEVKEDT